MRVFLDATGIVLGISAHGTVSLATFQAQDPDAVEQVDGAPAGLRHNKALGTTRGYHQRTSGDGTDISHYTWVPVNRCLRLLRVLHNNELPPGKDHTQIDLHRGLTQRLHHRHTVIFRGEVRQECYWIDTAETLLVAKVDYVWTRNASGLLTANDPTAQTGDPAWIGREGVMSWACEDDTFHPVTKQLTKIYSGWQAQEEGQRRRGLLWDVLAADVLKALIVTRAVNPASPTQGEIDSAIADAEAYSSKYVSDLSTFFRTGKLDFKTPPNSPNITDDTEAWLDNDLALLGQPGVTIRALILGALQGIND